MKIKYILDKKSKSTYAIATQVDSHVEGVDWFIVESLIDAGLLNRRDVMPTPSLIRSWTSVAKLDPKDEFDEKTGRDVARDKLLIKYYTWQHEALEKVSTALSEYRTFMTRKAVQYINRVNRADNRLLEY